MSKASYPKRRTRRTGNARLKLAKRFRVIGVEIVGLAAFLIFIMLLQLVESSWNLSIEQFAIVYAIIGIKLILVGLESLSLSRRLPME